MQIFENFPLSEILFYKIGGLARFLIKVANQNDLVEALQFVRNNNVARVLPVGLGSNLLMTDIPFDGAILWFEKGKELSIQKTEDSVKAFASNTLDDLIQFSFANNVVGISWAGGLPSSVGAAARGNIGCFGHEIKDVVAKVEVYDMSSDNFEKRELTNNDLMYQYRNSFLKQHKNLIVSNVFFSLQSGNEKEMEDAKREYQYNITYREKNHPIEYPSCGSVFKNITKKEEVEKILSIWEDIQEISQTKWHNKIAMGYVIKRLGLSGMQKGNAQISAKHANYIVNLGGASFNDVYFLIETIREKFSSQFGFIPEPEVEIIDK